VKQKALKDSVSREDLTDKQEQIVDKAIQHPNLTHSELADRIDPSPSYVSDVHQDYLEEEFIVDAVTPDDLDEDIYEVIVAGMRSMEEVDRVERQYDIDLNRGDEKEADVVVWASQGSYEFMVMIECKFHGTAVEQDVPAAMAWYEENSDVNQTLIISSSGFQSGAKSIARDTGIELYQFDELRREELQGRMMQFNFNITVNPQQAEIVDLRLEPIKGSPHEGDVSEYVNRNPALFDEERRPTGKNVFHRMWEASLDKSPGVYTEEIDERLMLLDDQFYRLDEIEYEVYELDSAEVEYEFDAYEEYDLYLKNVLVDEEEQVDLVSIKEAIQAFEENVR
jgi:hypothetical protein